MESAGFSGVGIWSPVDIEDRQCAAFSFPSRSFYIERIDNEWHVLTIAAAGSSCSFSQRVEKPESSAWRHYLLKDNRRLQAVPALPDRPVVVRSDRSLTLLGGERALFFLHIPVFFRLTALGSRRMDMLEEPIAPLSNTWFGDPFTGELCYALATRLHQTIDTVPYSGYEAVCPLSIANESETILAINRICLHVETVDVYMGIRLWTNQIAVVFKGTEQTTQIQIDKKAPGFENGLKLVCEAREQTESRLMRRTFSMFKYFGGI